jgi:hypothetical protein
LEATFECCNSFIGWFAHDGVGFMEKELMMASTVGTDFVMLATRVKRKREP